MSKNINIPLITDLVMAGNPRLKAQADEAQSTSFDIDGLNMRIDEIESAIGQDQNGSTGRAFAMRAENNQQNKRRNTNIITEAKNKETQ